MIRPIACVSAILARVGDAALALVHRIEDFLVENAAVRFRRAVVIQVCPSIWGVEPSALKELRVLLNRPASDAESAILQEALSRAEQDDASHSGALMAFIGAYNAAPAWQSDAERQARILTTRRIEQAEIHLARALARCADAQRPTPVSINP